MSKYIEKPISTEGLLNRLEWNTDKNTGCWNITSHVKGGGYPRMNIEGKSWGINRAVYVCHYGRIHWQDVVRHTCDNPMCINPDHLIVGTKQDNTQDMISRGRDSKWSNGKGRNGKKQVLTTDQINLIKASSLSSYKLAEIYPVSAVQIRRIKNGSRCVNI